MSVGAIFSTVRQTLSICGLTAMMLSRGMLPASALQGLVLALEFVDVLGPVDEEGEHLRVGGLLVEVVGAAGDGLHGVGAVVVAGDDDDLGLRRQAGSRRASPGPR
jgi:hypothetical protein